MPNPHPKINVDLSEYAKKHSNRGQTGARTEQGKRRVSLNAFKHGKNRDSKKKQFGRLSRVSKLASCGNCPIKDTCPHFDPEDKGCELRYLAYVDWVINSNKDEIKELNDVCGLLKGKLIVNELRDGKEGKINNLSTLKLIKEITDTLVKLHKLKQGDEEHTENEKKNHFQELRETIMESKRKSEKKATIKQIFSTFLAMQEEDKNKEEVSEEKEKKEIIEEVP